MPRPAIEFDHLDLTPLDARRRLLTAVGQLRGTYHVHITPANKAASDGQRGYYFAVVCGALRDYENEQQIEKWDTDRAHEALKARVLGVEEVKHRDGRVLFTQPKSTAAYDTVEFSDYIERCRAWLVTWCDIATPDPDPEWRAKLEAKERNAA